MFSPKLISLLLAGSALISATAAKAQNNDDIGVEILQLLVDEGVIPSQKAQEILVKAKSAAELRRQRETPVSATTIDVPYVPEALRVEMREQIKREVIADARTGGWIAPNVMPAWLNGMTISGDFRLRYQGEFYPKSEPARQVGNFPYFPDFDAINRAGGVTNAVGFPLMNSTVDRNTMRYRARVGLDAKINDFISVGIRLADGDDSGAISTNKTLGDYFNKDAIWIDRAFVTLTPLKGLNITGGRMANPFFSTDLVWDPDINPEGIMVNLDHKFGDRHSVFASAGYFPLQENELRGRDRDLLAAQIGFRSAVIDELNIEAAVAYYDYRNVNSLRNAPDGSRLNDFTAPGVLSKGNSLFNIRTDGLTTLAGLASDFNLVNATASIAYTGFEGAQVRLTGDVVKNIGMISRADLLKLDSSSLVEPGDLGWQVRLDVGRTVISKFGDWRFAAAYKRIETDAVLDIFTDSDFGLGGTDVQGYHVEGEFGVYKNTSIGFNWFSTDSIKRAPFSVDVLQISLSTRF